MKTLLISMVIGIVAGLIDIIPMVIKKMDTRRLLSAFLQYFFVAIVIVNSNLPGIAWWLQGMLISLALSLPIIVIVSEKDQKTPFIIAGMSIILGALISVAGHVLLLCGGF